MQVKGSKEMSIGGEWKEGRASMYYYYYYLFFKLCVHEIGLVERARYQQHSLFFFAA